MPTILYEDPHLLLIEKPVGIPSQEADGDCLPHRLMDRGYPVKVVHRLDKPTGGVMVYARTDKAAAKLSTLVGQHDQFQKEYLAVVQGVPAETEGTYTDLLYHDVKRNKSYVVDRARKGVREAKLDYSVLETVTTDEGIFSLVRVRLHTGRTHQLRVHMASVGCPLTGDWLYGTEDRALISRPALHSYILRFTHPLSGEALEITAPLPQDMRDLLEEKL